MGLFDFMRGKHVEHVDDDSCENDRRRIDERLREVGLLDTFDVPARFYIRFDEITPEIVPKITLCVGTHREYEILVPNMLERAELNRLIFHLRRRNGR